MASANPVTAFRIARSIARHREVPWIAEYRDLWADNPYRRVPRARRNLDRAYESRLVASSAAIITVSEVLGTALSRFGRPVHVVENGFDPESYPSVGGTAASNASPISIVYTGTIYPGRRRPNLLFSALSTCSIERRKGFRVRFFGRNTVALKPLVREYGLGDCVELGPAISSRDAYREQRKAGAALLLIWDDPRAMGVYTAKFFEYLGARRPILLLGSCNSAAGRFLLEHKYGVCARTEQDVLDFLGNLEIYRSQYDRDESYRQFSADALAEKLEGVLLECMDSRLRASTGASTESARARKPVQGERPFGPRQNP
jgi:glycosyltransferase involved in cell wall biosynthesis